MIDCPSYRYPSMAMAAQVLAVVGLGVAREAIDEVVGIANKKNSITGAPSMADRPGFQIALAQMEAQLRSARAWFYEETDRVWHKAARGRRNNEARSGPTAPRQHTGCEGRSGSGTARLRACRDHRYIRGSPAPAISQ